MFFRFTYLTSPISGIFQGETLLDEEEKLFNDVEQGRNSEQTNSSTSRLLNEDGQLPSTTKSKIKLLSLNDLNEQFMKINIRLVLVTIVVYVIVGVFVYHHLLHWNGLDSLYFLVTTVLSIGYGDFKPQTRNQRLFTAFYIILGIAICSTAVGTLSTILQTHHERTAKLRNIRATLLMQDEQPSSSSSNVVFQHDLETSNSLPDFPTSVYHGTTTIATAAPTTNTSISKTTSINTTEDTRTVSFARTKSFLNLALTNLSMEKPQKKSLKELRDASLFAFQEDYYQLRKATILDIVYVFIILIVGMITMHCLEHWTLSDSFYWAVVTIFTVGYGDFVPHHNSSKIFTIIYTIFGCACMAKVFTDMIRYPLMIRLLKNEERVIQQLSGATASPALLSAIFEHDLLYKLIPDIRRHEEEMTKCEFVLLILYMINKIEEKDVFLAAKIFEDLDRESKGFFSLQDMQAKVNEAKQKRTEQQLEQQKLLLLAAEENNNNHHHHRGSFNFGSSFRSSFQSKQASQYQRADSADEFRSSLSNNILAQMLLSDRDRSATDKPRTRKHFIGKTESKTNRSSLNNISNNLVFVAQSWSESSVRAPLLGSTSTSSATATSRPLTNSNHNNNNINNNSTNLLLTPNNNEFSHTNHSHSNNNNSSSLTQLLNTNTTNNNNSNHHNNQEDNNHTILVSSNVNNEDNRIVSSGATPSQPLPIQYNQQYRQQQQQSNGSDINVNQLQFGFSI
jgi:hypothetical protein